MVSIFVFLSAYIAGFIHTLAGNPATAFMLYQLVYFMYPQGRWWGGSLPDISYSYFVVLLMVGVYVMGFSKYNKNHFFETLQFKWVFLVCILFSIVSFYAINPDLHNDAVIYFIKLIVIICIAYKLIDSKKALDGSLYAYVLGAAYIGLLTYQSGRNSENRVEGIGTVDSPESNGIAAAIAPSAIIALYYLWGSKKNSVRVCMLVAGALIANALVLINSRAAFLATFIGGAYFVAHLYFSKQQRWHQKRNTVLLVILGLCGAFTIIDESTMVRLRSFTETKVQISGPAEKETATTRLYFWVAAAEMATDYPFGLGYKGFDSKASEYIPIDVYTGSHRDRSVHSTWFQSLSETGYLGLFCFISMLLSCFHATARCKKRLLSPDDIDDYFKVVALEAGLLTYMVSMSFMNRMTAEILYWLILFTACAYNIYVLKPQKTALEE